MARYVLPVDKPAVVDASGFLDVSMADAWWSGVDDRPQPASELAGTPWSFVLLAADGAGKSTVLDGLRNRETGATEVDLRVLDRTGMGLALQDAIAAGTPIYLDALDEAALHESALFRILERHLTTPAAARVPWRLACRPAAWNPALAEALRSALPDFRQLKLLPLTREAAAELVSDVGADPAGFVDALASASLGRLAASPLRMRSAAVQWHRTGRLPDSQLEAIRFEIDQLLTETDTGRPLPTVPADRRRRLAARLAAMTVFGRASRFPRAAEPSPGVLRVFDLPSVPEPDEPGTLITPAEYEEVLGTALFDAAPGASVSFRHQQYAEFLAAAYLSERRVDRRQLPALLGVRADGVLPGVMTGVAAWAGALNPELVGELVVANGVVFAQAAVELPSYHLRALAVEGVLAKAATGDADPVWGLDLSQLAHPGLEATLARQLGQGLDRPEQLWWTARLAEAGNCRSLVAALLREVLNSAWPGWARRAGVAAVAALGDDKDLLQLQGLARLDLADDPDDEVLAAVIEALYPRLLGTPALLEVLRPQRNVSYLGAYYVLLGEVSGELPADDLPAVLTWASAHVRDGENAYGVLFPRLIQRAWAHATWPVTCGPLGQLVAGLAGDPDWPHWPGPDKPPWAGADPEQRRSLAVSVAQHLAPGQSYELIDLGLLVPDDLGWLIRKLPALAHSAQDALASCVPQLARHPTAGEADLILAMPEDHPAYSHTQWLRQPVPTDSELARQWRQRRESAVQAENLQSAGRVERRLQLAAALGDARNDPAGWWRVALWLAARDSGLDDGTVFTHDLTARPGWSLLDDQERRDVLDLGIRYLAVHQIQPWGWIGRPSVSVDQVAADWSGVYLLTTLAIHDPRRLAGIEPSVWRACAAAIVSAWNSGGEEGEQARCRLVDLAPPCEKQTILDAALGQLDALQEHGGRLAPRQLYNQLSHGLAPRLAERLLDGSYTGQLAQALLGMLVKNAPQPAVAVCRQILSDPGSPLATEARRGLAELDPAGLIDDLEASSATPADIADIAPYLALGVLDDDHLAILGHQLLRCVPFATDPQEQYGVFPGDRQYQVRSIRRTVMQLLAQHGHTRFFEDLTQQPHDPGQETIAWYLRQANAQAADLAYTGLDPNQLLQLLSRADARLIRHDRDLLDVVVTQLDNLQHDLTRLHASRYLWNLSPDSSTLKSEDDISDWVCRELKSRLSPATIIDRELQVARKRQGIGTRIDLTATSPAATQPPSTARVIAEAKLVTNAGLMTAMQDQLAQRYMIPTGLQHGIYLVYWIDPDQRPAGSAKGPADRDVLMQQLMTQAAETGDRLHIHPYILDVSHP